MKNILATLIGLLIVAVPAIAGGPVTPPTPFASNSVAGRVIPDGVTCNVVDAVGTLTCGGSGSPPGGSTNDLEYNAGGAFGGITLTDGQIPVGQTGAAPLAKTVSGDATLTAGGAVAIGVNKILNGMLAQMPAHTFKGNNTSSTANAADLTATQLTAELNACTTTLKGLVPALPNDATQFLDGTCHFSSAALGSATGLAPGFTKTPGTQNTGADTVGNSGTISGQLWPKTVGSSCTVNVNCDGANNNSGTLLIPNAASVTLSLPNPSAGTKGVSYPVGSDGTNGYTLTTVGGTALFYGCPGGGGTTLVQPVNVDVVATDDATGYKCTAITSPIIPVPLTYAPGLDATAVPVSGIYQSRIIVGIRCTPEVVSGGAATLQPVKAASTVAIASGTNLTSNTCDVNTGAFTDQSLTVSVTTLAAGDRLGLKGSGSTITNNNTVAKGLVTFFLR